MSAFFLAKDIIVKTIFENTVEALSGLGISVKNIDVAIFKPAIRVDGMVILNPAPFKEKVMAEINQLYLDYDIVSGFKNDIHIRDMVLDVSLVGVVKTANGQNNLNSLKVVKALENIDKGKKNSNGMPHIRIDRLHLKGGRVTYTDYTKAPYPAVSEFECRVDERYENITNPYELVSLVVSRSLVKTSPSSMIGFDLAPLQGNIHGVVSQGMEAFKGAYECLLKKTEAQ